MTIDLARLDEVSTKIRRLAARFDGKLADAQFEESKHPRDEGGKFSTTSASKDPTHDMGEIARRMQKHLSLSSGGDDSVKGIKEFLSFSAATQGRRSPSTLVLRHGQQFKTDENTFKGQRGTPKACFQNAAHLALNNPNMTYVEGYTTVHGIPISHAWCVNKEGTVVDPTIVDGEARISGYFGIPFKTEYLAKGMVKNKVYGLLGYMSQTARDLVEEKVDPKTVIANVKPRTAAEKSDSILYLSDAINARIAARADKEWNEADHPRGQPDNKGQFVEGGSKSSTTTEKYKVPSHEFNAAHYAAKLDNPYLTSQDILKKFPEDVAVKLKEYAHKALSATPTDQIHKREGKYTPERQALHRKILFDGITCEVVDEKTGEKRPQFFPGLLTEENIKKATPPPGVTPRITILGGRGGSGKSWFKGRVYDPDTTLMLDSDNIKMCLPEYEGWNANQVHEESSEIFDQAVSIAKRLGLNIVHEATMKTPANAHKLVKEFHDAGYEVDAHYMYLPREKAAERAVHRFLGPTKRFVPPETVLSMIKNEQSFEDVKPMLKRWSFRDNDVPMGEEPRLIAEKTD